MGLGRLGTGPHAPEAAGCRALVFPVVLLTRGSVTGAGAVPAGGVLWKLSTGGGRGLVWGSCRHRALCRSPCVGREWMEELILAKVEGPLP